MRTQIRNSEWSIRLAHGFFSFQFYKSSLWKLARYNLFTPSLQCLAIETWYNMCYFNGLWSMKFLKFEPLNKMKSLTLNISFLSFFLVAEYLKYFWIFPPCLTPCTTSSSYCFVRITLSPLREVFVGSYIKRIPMHCKLLSKVKKWHDCNFYSRICTTNIYCGRGFYVKDMRDTMRNFHCSPNDLQPA